jgi:glycosyltransferase involved in cell wall biosynthesis
MRNPRISILMSVYNSPTFLSDAINSILSQTFEDFEFLIIDDGSNDQTSKILGVQNDKRIRIITNHHNIGLTHSLNKLLKLAQGEYIARMDADDISLPRRLEYQVDFLDKHPDTGLVGCNYYEIDENDNVIKDCKPPSENLVLKWSLLFQNAFCHSATMFRQQCLSQAGNYDEQLSYAQDYDLWLRIAQNNSIHNLDLFLHKWRRNKTSGISETCYHPQQESATQTSHNAIRRLFPETEIETAKLSDLREYINWRTLPKDLGSTERLLIKTIDALWDGFPRDRSHRKKQSQLKGYYCKRLVQEYHSKGLGPEARRCLKKSIRYDLTNLNLAAFSLFLKTLQSNR